ncbi:hypothetical protein BGX26_010717 [Mortierella sp. AD094]|nr:hypothetical protein BGX26_010717 [Mortierella sp. AD094]
MTKESVSDNFLQAFRARSSTELFFIQTHRDTKTSHRIVLWKDILLPCKDAKYIANGGEIVTFMKGDDFEDLIPLRIKHHPDTILEVIVEDTSNSTDTTSGDISSELSAHSSGSNISPLQVGEAKISAALLLASENSSTKVDQPQEYDVPATMDRIESLSVSDIPLSSNSLAVYPTAMSPGSQPALASYNQLANSYLKAMTDGHANLAATIKTHMDQHFGDLRIEMDNNKALQHQVLQMQEEMLQMQKKTLDRLAIIQDHVQTLLIQTYELQEYPIPRLFIILPKPAMGRVIFGKLFSDQFQLFFLCECGKHTMTEGSTIPHEIHLAKHEGYEISKPNEFFEKYGSYILTLMQMFKYGIIAAGVVVPYLEKFKIVEGMDEIQKYLDQTNKTMGALVGDAISFLEEQQKSSTNGIDVTGQARIEELEVLEGAELRQLESYLSIKDSGRVLGNLYRIVTAEGHVKWVCIDHYKANYREKSVQELRDIVVVNKGSYTEEIGKIETEFSSSTLAKQFYGAMVKARGVQELDIKLSWDVTMDDLKKFADALTKAKVSHLAVNGSAWEGPAGDYINRVHRYDPIAQLASNGRIQSLIIREIDDFFKRFSSSSMTMTQQLRILEIGRDIKLGDRYGSFLTGILDNCPSLTKLRFVTPRQRSLIEFTMDRLGHLQMAEGTHLDFGSGDGQAKVTLGLNFWKNKTLRAKVASTA